MLPDKSGINRFVRRSEYFFATYYNMFYMIIWYPLHCMFHFHIKNMSALPHFNHVLVVFVH